MQYCHQNPNDYCHYIFFPIVAIIICHGYTGDLMAILHFFQENTVYLMACSQISKPMLYIVNYSCRLWSCNAASYLTRGRAAGYSSRLVRVCVTSESAHLAATAVRLQSWIASQQQSVNSGKFSYCLAKACLYNVGWLAIRGMHSRHIITQSCALSPSTWFVLFHEATWFVLFHEEILKALEGK